MKNKISSISLIAIAIILLFQITVPNRYNKPERVIAYDVVTYYDYLPLMFIKKDLRFSFWKDESPLREHYIPLTLEDGTAILKTTYGVSCLYAPFFGVAHLLAAPLGYEADGFTLPYSFALLLSGVFWVVLGLFFLRKMLLKYFPDSAVAITILVLTYATNLYWYATFEAAMSHSFSFGLFCLFLFLTDLWYRRPCWSSTLLLSITFAFIVLIRPSNSIIIIVFLLYNIFSFAQLKERITLLLKNHKHFIVMAIIVVAVWLPQAMYWHYVTGSYIFYSYTNERFFFNDPKIFEVLFGFRKGLFIYSPSLLFILPGLWMMFKNKNKFFWGISIFSIINIYIIASWWCWWYGGGFAMRPLVESYALLSIPFACFVTWVLNQKTKTKIVLFALLTLLSLQSIVHTAQYYHEVIYYEGMTSKLYFKSFWKTKPIDYWWNYVNMPDYDEALKGNR